MDKFYSRYIDGDYETGKLYFAEAVEGTEWGVDFRLIEDNIKDDYATCLVFRESNPMVDEDWEIGTFMSISESLNIVKENWDEWEAHND